MGEVAVVPLLTSSLRVEVFACPFSLDGSEVSPAPVVPAERFSNPFQLPGFKVILVFVNSFKVEHFLDVEDHRFDLNVWMFFVFHMKHFPSIIIERHEFRVTELF